MKGLPAALLATLLLAPDSFADWPQYLGDNCAGIAAGKIRSDWKATPPKTLWKVKIGKGCGSFSVAGGRAYAIGNDGKKDTVWCLEAKTGKEVWRHEYLEKLDPNLYEGGPNSTPTLDGNLVFTLSKTGKLFCLDASNGHPVWSVNLKSDFGGKMPRWGYTASPVVDGKLLYVLPCSRDGALFALDKTDGKVKWHSPDVRQPGYAAPVLATIRGRKAALVFYGRTIVAHDLNARGKVLFDHRWNTSYNINASNPQYHKGKVFITSGYKMGCAILDVTGASPRVVYSDRAKPMIFQNTILTDGRITGAFGDKRLDTHLTRLDIATGKVFWSVKLPGTRGSCALAGDTLVVLCETGDLICGKVSDKGFTETGRIRPLEQRCWSPLAISDGLILARNNNGDAICLDVRP